MVVVLDNIRSAHNVGSIFRTADAVGISRVYLCGVTPGPIDRFGRWNSRIAKVALGAEQTVSSTHFATTKEALRQLKKERFRLLALEQSAQSIPLNGVKLSPEAWKSTALILGEEVRGLSLELLNMVDAVVEIPMVGKKESLNVAVAFGIAAYVLKFSMHGSS